MISEILKHSIKHSGDRSIKKLFAEKLELTGLSKTQFEKLANIQRRSLDGILDKTSKQTDIINLLKVGEFLELEIVELMILHFADRPIEEIKELQNSMETTFINKYFDLKALSSNGFIKKNTTVDELKGRICNFFQIESIYEYENQLNEVLYSRSKRNFSDKMKDFWIKSSYKYFELVNNPNHYSRHELVDLIPKIKPYTQNVEKGLITVFRALYNVGVTVVFQPSLPKTQVRGATFLIKDKPCIVITDLFKSYPTIWFALLHELHHVLYDLEHLKKTQYHLTGEPDLFLLQEDKANKFASDYLISEDKMRFIEPLINNPLMVSRFAKEIQVHPSIIYSQYQFRQKEKGKNYWGAFREHFPNVELAKKQLNVSNWDVESLLEAANKVRELLTV
ncbi:MULTISPECIES: ImmA/IrrE family metallo-endopeptidase [unclassified Carboxylicivirga]|uniref:ImmA/IrrE family metallo-endopeptidase n=1 Tax=Carboxylicivirga TaxID=1628153 RepID=UPI003D352673